MPKIRAIVAGVTGVLALAATFEAGLDWSLAVQSVTMAVCAVVAVALASSGLASFVTPPPRKAGFDLPPTKRNWSKLALALTATSTVVLLSGAAMLFANGRGALFQELRQGGHDLILLAPSGAQVDVVITLDPAVDMTRCAFTVPSGSARPSQLMNPTSRQLNLTRFTSPQAQEISCADSIGWSISTVPPIEVRSTTNRLLFELLIFVLGGILWLVASVYLFRSSSP